MRLPRVLALTAMAGSTLTAGVLGTAAPASANTLWCTAESATPCVASLEVDGEPYSGPGGEWDVFGSAGTKADGNWYVEAQVQRRSDPSSAPDPDLGAERPLITMNIRMELANNPRVVVVRGTGLSTFRDVSEQEAHEVRVTGRPVAVSNPCDPTGVEECSTEEVLEWEGRFDVTVTDAQKLTVEDDRQGTVIDDLHQSIRESLLGLDVETDAGGYTLPLTVSLLGTPRLELALANAQRRTDGTLVRGRTSMRIPAEFLRLGLGIPDPASLRPNGLAPELLGRGKGDLVVTRDGADMRVTATGITYPLTERTLRVVTGNIKPTAPGKVNAKRVRVRKGVIRFGAAKPRGAEVTGYEAVCRAKGTKHKVKGTSTRTRVVVKRLKPRTAYVCKVRATSEVGAGKWRKDRLRPRP